MPLDSVALAAAIAGLGRAPVQRKKSWNKTTASELGRVLWFGANDPVGYELTLHRFRKSVKGFAEPWPWPPSKERTTYAVEEGT